MSAHTQFWLLNAAGWLFYLLFSGAFFAVFSGQPPTGFILINAFAWCYYVPICGLIRWLIHRNNWFEHNQLTPMLLKLAVLNALIALLGQFLVSLYMLYALNIMTWETYSIKVLWVTSFQSWIILGVWVLLYYTIKQIRHSRDQQLRQYQLESTLKKAELQALKAQLNPHFIFNCLNNIRALALEDATTTRNMITHLSEMLKYSFQFDEQAQVSLGRELQHVRNYLALEKIQFEHRLSFEFDVDTNLEEVMIPTLSIQLLVENAIKHGISHAPNGGHIGITVQQKGQHLTIQVRNSGQLRTTTANSGIGLKNLQQRLSLLYGNRSEFSLDQTSENQVLAAITIPLEPSHD